MDLEFGLGKSVLTSAFSGGMFFSHFNMTIRLPEELSLLNMFRGLSCGKVNLSDEFQYVFNV